MIAWADNRDGNYDIYAQRYSQYGIALGTNFIVTKNRYWNQYIPNVKLWNNRIYCTWTNTPPNTVGYDIWANVLDWDNPTDIKNIKQFQLPSNFTLNQNYPNPFNSSTKISYSILRSNFVILKIYNMLGIEIKTIVNEFQNVGAYVVSFNANELSSGIYFYKLQVGNEFIQTKKMLFLR